MTETVRHDAARRRFVIDIDGQEAVLAYRREGDLLNFHHTFVPESLRGRGLAEKVVKAGFAYARDEQLKVLPTCPYISGTFLKRHEAYRSQVAGA